MKSHFELSPEEYEAQRQGHLHRRRAEIVAREVSALARDGDLVLELGCGPGDVLSAVARPHPSISFVGIDMDTDMIEYARAAHSGPNVTFEAMDIAATAPKGRARVVYSLDVLHHVHELEPFVRAVAGFVERDGCWTVVEPNSRNPYIWLHQERMRRAGLDEDHFRPAIFERAAADAGLQGVERTTAFLVPGFVQSVPRPVARVERALERVPVLGGSVVYRLAPA